MVVYPITARIITRGMGPDLNIEVLPPHSEQAEERLLISIAQANVIVELRELQAMVEAVVWEINNRKGGDSDE